MKRVGIYVRVSTEEQAEHGYSIDAQLETLRTYCRMYEMTVFKEYADRGVSGKSIEKRFELQQMIRDAKAGMIDLVLVWKFNRLARNTIDLLQIVEELRKYNVEFRSFSENFDTSSAMGKFALSMLGSVGELERNTIVENVKMGLKYRAKTGKHNGKVPLGYTIVDLGSAGAHKRKTVIEIVPEEAAVVKRIFEMFSNGHGYRSIANQLNHDGYKTKMNRPFSICSVKDILDNPFYTGKIRYNRYECWSEKRRRGKSAEPILVDGVHDHIIDGTLWEKVQFLRSKKSFTSTKRFDGKFLLTGILRCPKCGAAMTASVTKNTAKDGSKIVRTYYSCSNFRSKGSAVCSANSIRKDDAERFVTDRIRAVLAKPHILRGIVASINSRKKNRIQPLQEELEAIQTKLSQIEDKRKKYFELYELDDFDRELFSGRLGELDAERDQLLSRKSEIEFELNGDNSQTVSYEQVRSLIERFEYLLQESSFDQRKTLLHLIIQKISLNEKRQIDKIELAFDETTEQHFLIVAPSADNMAEGAFPLPGKAHTLNHKLIFAI
ncbi:recombinase family protein [Paenibacillus alkaliterrae]|uniref:recombinase family protein n=1 Tax=Paenibacillus alkaliterrae TaxID=320909 RepID=UPI001F3C9DA4|nr:recombinase family protein [Paenibacillus alkaliterrae]MCF2939930.1 recombinase family protein [Paenibacillus alkaliterrae]